MYIRKSTYRVPIRHVYKHIIVYPIDNIFDLSVTTILTVNR